ncbi:MAG: hypothetical protein PHT98_14395, partial [Kiritimatiellae bacterium]|nr:hypothetical protein [Kiritimatiellia bacterium]
MGKLIIPGVLCLSLVSACALFRQEPAKATTFAPEIITVEQGAIQNAGAGTEIWRGGPGDGVTNLIRYAVRVSDYSVNSMTRPGWDAFETREGVYHFEKMDKLFEYGIQYGQKVNLACFVTSCAGTKQKIDDAFCCYPAYVHEAM